MKLGDNLAHDVDNRFSQPATERVIDTPPKETHNLRDCVAIAVENYLEQLDGQMVTEVYQMVLAEVEAPLLQQIMAYTRNNQTKASILLGLNRGTLRKKLKQYGLLYGAD